MLSGEIGLARAWALGVYSLQGSAVPGVPHLSSQDTPRRVTSLALHRSHLLINIRADACVRRAKLRKAPACHLLVRRTILAGKSGDASPAMRAPAPVPLSAMISSDEEEDDEEAVAAPPPARRRGAMCQGSSSDDERANADDVDDASTAPPPVVTVPDAEAASTVEWDSDDDSAHVRPSVARAPESNIEAMDAAEEEEEEAGEPEPPMVMAAPGIVADENFADDDWDDDDM